MKEAYLYKKLDWWGVQCTACNHYCCPPEWKTGKCWVRKNIDGKLQLLVYELALWVGIDPIEKKPLYHFYPKSKIFSFGTAWCNMNCDFCQNWAMSQVSENKWLLKLWREMTPEFIIDYCKNNEITAIAYTYNEPTVFWEYAYDTMVLAKEAGIYNIFVSNGFFSKEMFEKMDWLLDAINVDLKSFNDKFYDEICGARVEPVLENIKKLAASNIHLEVTTLIIPWYNNSKEELENIAKFLSDLDNNIPWHVSAFSKAYKMEYAPNTTLENIKEACEIWKKAGLKYVYAGNVVSLGLENTVCPECGSLLITRNWYNVNIVGLEWNKCSECWYEIKGCFN